VTAQRLPSVVHQDAAEPDSQARGYSGQSAGLGSEIRFGSPQVLLHAARHLESPGTKSYAITEARSLVPPFGACKIGSAVSFGNLLLGEVGQQHVGVGLTLTEQFWPGGLSAGF
jgi:hypothetical protein